MSQKMSNITVKGADGVSDVLFTAIIGAANDRSPAIWRNLSGSTVPMAQPEFSMGSHDNGNKSARRISHSGVWPVAFADPGTGLFKVSTQASHSGSFVLPSNMAPDKIKDFVYQYTNWLASELIRQATCDRYAPRG